MYLICIDFSVLTGQTSLPPNRPTSLKVKNVHNFVIFQRICMKLCMVALNVNTYSFSKLTGLAIFRS